MTIDAILYMINYTIIYVCFLNIVHFMMPKLDNNNKFKTFVLPYTITYWVITIAIMICCLYFQIGMTRITTGIWNFIERLAIIVYFGLCLRVMYTRKSFDFIIKSNIVGLAVSILKLGIPYLI